MICWNREPATHIPLSCPDSYLPLQSVFFLLFQVTLHTSHGSHFFLKLFSTQPFKEQVQNHVLAPLIMYKKQVEQIALAINLRNPFVWVEYRILISECIYNQLKFESVQPVLDMLPQPPPGWPGHHNGDRWSDKPWFCISCDVSAQLHQLLSRWPDSH